MQLLIPQENAIQNEYLIQLETEKEREGGEDDGGGVSRGR